MNNAGAGAPGTFLKQSLEKRTQIIQLIVTAPMQLSHVFGQQMSQRRRGGIIFTSSIAGYIGMPKMANYAATKSFILSLGTSLNIELKSKGVDVLVLSPGATRTEMMETEGMDTSKMPMPWMDAKDVAAVGAKSLGKKSSVIPGRMNSIMNFMASRLMPHQFALNMFGTMMGRTMDPALM